LPRLQAVVGDAYRVERELGGGGMSRLFLAEEVSLRRQVVIKVLRPDHATEISLARFHQEIQVAAHLQHPHVLPVLACGGKDGLVYFVMPYVAGESLRQRLDRDGPLPVSDAVRYLREIADALAYAHREGVVHRDIKPENILVQNGHALLADFGIAQAVAQARQTDRLTAPGVVVGTPGYMAPEQVAGPDSVDGRSDVFALAVVGYEMLTGGRPINGSTPANSHGSPVARTPRPLGELRPETPPHVAAAIMRALAPDPAQRTPAAEALRDQLDPEGKSGRRPWPRHRRLGVAAAGVLAAAAVATWGLLRSDGSPPADPDLVAVAPFDVLEPDLTLWREGLVDVVSRDLDGAGPLRSVAPTTVIRRWRGRADPTAAAELGRRTGAGVTVFGQLLGAGPDSVRLAATVLEVPTRRVLATIRLTESRSRMDRLADSLTLGVLQELGRTRTIGATRTASIGSTVVPAIRAFLRGEQLFRQTNWDSALAYYEQAVRADSNFALAWRRMGIAVGWQRSGFDSVSRHYHLRAGALNRGLSPRDSLLLLADSLAGAMFAGMKDSAFYQHARRLYATSEELTARYPEDPEAWYGLGETRFHFGFAPGLGTGARAALDAFERAVAIDSTFGPAYIHPVDLALTLDGPADANRYIRGYLALDPRDVNAQGIRTLAALLDGSADGAGLLDTLPPPVLRFLAVNGLGRWPDSAEAAMRLVLDAWERHGDSLHLPPQLPAQILAYRGHFAEAFARFGPKAPAVALWGGLLGALPADTIDAVFRAYEGERSGALQFAASWWAWRRDTAALRRHVATMDSLATGHSSLYLRPIYRYGAGAARAYLALARGDSAAALRGFEALPDSLCSWCTIAPLTRARLLSAAGRDREAYAHLRRDLNAMFEPTAVLWALERGRVAEQIGDRPAAADAYRFVADVWRRADPALRPYVEEARAALERLSREPVTSNALREWFRPDRTTSTSRTGALPPRPAWPSPRTSTLPVVICDLHVVISDLLIVHRDSTAVHYNPQPRTAPRPVSWTRGGTAASAGRACGPPREEGEEVRLPDRASPGLLARRFARPTPKTGRTPSIAGLATPRRPSSAGTAAPCSGSPAALPLEPRQLLRVAPFFQEHLGELRFHHQCPDLRLHLCDGAVLQFPMPTLQPGLAAL
jgi:serine/threonine-protein kinase